MVQLVTVLVVVEQDWHQIYISKKLISGKMYDEFRYLGSKKRKKE